MPSEMEMPAIDTTAPLPETRFILILNHLRLPG
jgi:hypothetical protein